MSILSNLVQHYDGQHFGSLLFCQSPREQPSIQDTKDRLSCTAKTTSLGNIERSAKSLSKMDLNRFVGKVDPKERILHRIVYKLEMKCRKQYYNFMVKLENFNKSQHRSIKNKHKNIEKI